MRTVQRKGNFRIRVLPRKRISFVTSCRDPYNPNKRNIMNVVRLNSQKWGRVYTTLAIPPIPRGGDMVHGCHGTRVAKLHPHPHPHCISKNRHISCNNISRMCMAP